MNYYTTGIFYNGDKYHSVHSSIEDAIADIESIKETEAYFIKMNMPHSMDDSTVQFSGACIVIEHNGGEVFNHTAFNI